MRLHGIPFETTDLVGRSPRSEHPGIIGVALWRTPAISATSASAWSSTPPATSPITGARRVTSCFAWRARRHRRTRRRSPLRPHSRRAELPGCRRRRATSLPHGDRRPSVHRRLMRMTPRATKCGASRRSPSPRATRPAGSSASTSRPVATGMRVRWANRQPNPHLVAWLRTFTAAPLRRRCLVVGCGLGDGRRGARLRRLRGHRLRHRAHGRRGSAVAFSAVRRRLRRRRHPPAQPTASMAAFDLVFEAFTLQGLPVAMGGRRRCNGIAALVAPGGRLFVLCRAREAAEPLGELPWPLSRTD